MATHLVILQLWVFSTFYIFSYLFSSLLLGNIPEDLLAIHDDPNRIRFPNSMRNDVINRDYIVDIDVLPEQGKLNMLAYSQIMTVNRLVVMIVNSPKNLFRSSSCCPCRWERFLDGKSNTRRLIMLELPCSSSSNIRSLPNQLMKQRILLQL